jgi:hypothetical protein
MTPVTDDIENNPRLFNTNADDLELSPYPSTPPPVYKPHQEASPPLPPAYTNHTISTISDTEHSSTAPKPQVIRLLNTHTIKVINDNGLKHIVTVPDRAAREAHFRETLPNFLPAPVGWKKQRCVPPPRPHYAKRSRKCLVCANIIVLLVCTAAVFIMLYLMNIFHVRDR